MTQWIRVLAASPDNLRLSHGPASSVPFLAGEETGATKKFILLSATHSVSVLLGLVGQACGTSNSGGGKTQCLRSPRFSLQDPYGGSQLPVNSSSKGFSPLSDLV